MKIEFDQELLIEIQDYINELEEQVGLRPETMKDIEMAISNKMKELNKPAPEVELRQVWRNKETGSKVIITEDKIEGIKSTINEYDYVCDRPHGDGDFSYFCNFSHCRCWN